MPLILTCNFKLALQQPFSMPMPFFFTILSHQRLTCKAVNTNEVPSTLKFIPYLPILVYYEKKASALCYVVRVRYFTFSF